MTRSSARSSPALPPVLGVGACACLVIRALTSISCCPVLPQTLPILDPFLGLIGAVGSLCDPWVFAHGLRHRVPHTWCANANGSEIGCHTHTWCANPTACESEKKNKQKKEARARAFKGESINNTYNFEEEIYSGGLEPSRVLSGKGQVGRPSPEGSLVRCLKWAGRTSFQDLSKAASSLKLPVSPQLTVAQAAKAASWPVPQR